MTGGAPELTPEDFEEFYCGLHSGRRPYAWQVRATTELTEGIAWDALDAPTGAGKTTLIECFLFALACQPVDAGRRLPLRLFWVVDRRAVVDQVFEHATIVAEALENGRGGLVGATADRLRAFGGMRPVQLQRWRGGIGRERQPLFPTVPTVVCSTVDQVGSRLLFRGYGTSPRSRAVDAALVGTDSVVVLDEAHVSAPFRQTSASVAAAQRAVEGGSARPLHLISMSATLDPQEERPTFRLTSAELSEPPIRRRVDAIKKTRLVMSADRVHGLISEARALAGPGRVVGVVANTVTEARSAHEELSKHGEALLVIGPSRPLDRDAVLPRIPGRDARTEQVGPLFVVATQTIEVGLDLDFDALVTAAASFSALVQRFGRLDRAGAAGHSEGVIVASRQPCPVYGEVAAATWEWLRSRADEDGTIDIGPAAVEELKRADPPSSPQTPRAPLLTPWHVEALAQTSVDPVASPDIEPFLHGEDAQERADVQLAWRADLLPTDGASGNEEEWTTRIAQRRPHGGELVSLPIAAARRWLHGLTSLAFGDIESTDLAERAEQGEHPRSVVILGPPGPDGPASPRLIDRPADIRPGDVVVVPASYGGCDEFGWAPESRGPVEDLGDLDLGRPRLRLSPQLARPATLVAQAMELADSLAGDELPEDEVYGLVRDEVVASLREHPLRWLGGACSDAANLARANALRQVADGMGPTGRAVLYPAANARSKEGPAHGLVLVPDRPAVRRSARRVTYADHTSAVEKRAEQFARSGGYDERLTRTVCLAARYHDAGKLDPRFQMWLNDGVPADPASPLAKSGRAFDDARVASALEASGWPRRKRHEALSAALLDATEPVRLTNVDRDLALFLVATHHGRARPFYEEAPDERPVEIRVEIEGGIVSVPSDTHIAWGKHAMRFVRLVEQHGAWGLASIEASLVLADRTVSAEEGEDT